MGYVALAVFVATHELIFETVERFAVWFKLRARGAAYCLWLEVGCLHN